MSPILYKFQNNYFKNKYLNHWRKWTFENLLISRCLKSVKWPKIELKLLPLIYCIDMKKVPVFSVKFLVTLKIKYVHSVNTYRGLLSVSYSSMCYSSI